MTTPKFPEINVKMGGEDGNALAVTGRVLRALKEAGVDPDVRDAFITEALGGDYDHLIAAVFRWVTIDSGFNNWLPLDWDNPDAMECSAPPQQKDGDE